MITGFLNKVAFFITICTKKKINIFIEKKERISIKDSIVVDCQGVHGCSSMPIAGLYVTNEGCFPGMSNFQL